MTICHILTYSYENGGTAKFVYDLASYQAAQGDTVKILSTETLGHTPYPVPEGVEMLSFKPETLTKVLPLYSSDLHKYVKQESENIDAFHLHCLWNYGELMTDKLALHDKTIVTIHGSLHSYTFGGLTYYKRLLFTNWFQKSFLKKIKTIHVNHAGEVRDVKDYLGFQPEQLVVIPNGTEINEIKQAPIENRKRNELLYIGRLHHKKGFDILMPAFKKVVEKRPDAKLIIAGPDGGMLDFIEKFIAENNLKNNVEILGTVVGEAKVKLFETSGIFVLPTHSEGFSLAVLETLMYGLPAVVSDQTGLSPLLENYNAAIVPALNPDAFAEGILSVLNDSKLYEQLPQNGKRLLEEKLEKNKVCGEFNRLIYNRYRH